MTDDKITQLPVRFKAPPSPSDKPTLQIVHRFDLPDRKECGHRNATYLVAEQEATVECGDCGAKLDPIWVLRHLTHEEHRYNRLREAYQAELVRLRDRQRTKCECCGQMTRISHR